KFLATQKVTFKTICLTNIEHGPFDKKLAPFNVLGQRIEMIGWHQVVPSTIERFEKLLRFSGEARDLVRKGVYLQIESSGRNQTEAFRSAEKSFAYFRGLLNLT